MRAWHIGLAMVVAIMLSAGCGGSEPAATPADAGLGDTYTSGNLDTSYTGALNASGQLMLGTLMLEGADDAVTPEQASVLLPLWQAFQGGALQASAERNAVLTQIEAQMTPAQLEAISAMQLTSEALATWAQEQGMNRGFGGGQAVSPDAQAGRGAQFAGDEDIPPEMATRRAQFEGMSDEDRAGFRATAQAGGMSGGYGGGVPDGHGGRAGGGPGQSMFLVRPLIDLLEERAAEA